MALVVSCVGQNTFGATSLFMLYFPSVDNVLCPAQEGSANNNLQHNICGTDV